ncbi:MAG: hypothetical protein R2825_21960 [Saprospiraceae bacterium]
MRGRITHSFGNLATASPELASGCPLESRWAEQSDATKRSEFFGPLA